MGAAHLSFTQALEAASAGQIFTTHTPVPAGHDHFPPDLMARYFSDYASSLGLSIQDFYRWGVKIRQWDDKSIPPDTNLNKLQELIGIHAGNRDRCRCRSRSASVGKRCIIRVRHAETQGI